MHKKRNKNFHHFQINVTFPATQNYLKYINSLELTLEIHLEKTVATVTLLFIG